MRSSCAATFLTTLALCGAGCFSDRGVAIEIDVAATGATSVELYVGNTACGDQDDRSIRCGGGIAPLEGGEHLAGRVWFRKDLVPFVAQVRGGKAAFRLQAEAATTLPILIAVGSSGPGPRIVGTATLRALEVPVDGARVVTATLIKASELEPSPGSPTEDRARVWNQEADPRGSCVVVEHASTGTRDFIVPVDDPDCDDFTGEVDCDKAAYRAAITEDGLSEEPACYVASSDSPTVACKVGGFECRDGEGFGPRCLTTRDEICAPRPFCCGETPQVCAARALERLELVPHLRCMVRVGDPPCKTESPAIDLHGRLGNDGCADPKLSSLALDELAAAGRSYNFDGIDLEVTGAEKPCQLRVQINSGTHANGQAFGLIRLSPNDRESTVLLPVIFDFSAEPGACPPGPGVMCNFHDPGIGPGPIPDPGLGDPMWSCLQ